MAASPSATLQRPCMKLGVLNVCPGSECTDNLGATAESISGITAICHDERVASLANSHENAVRPS